MTKFISYEAEAATLSLYVYKDNDQPPLPDGIEILAECPKELITNDYFGMAFIRNKEFESPTVYIVHRGTVLNPSILLDDIRLFL